MDSMLKPCPFCNGEAEHIKTHLYGKISGHFIACKKCECQSKIYSSKQNAFKFWNKRFNEK